MVIKYKYPDHWIKYDPMAIIDYLTNAKATIISLTSMPIQRNWAEEMQYLQLKREVAGTSRIEGADFTEKEFEAAIKETPEKLVTRSQRQAAAAIKTYRWIADLPEEQSIDSKLIKKIHCLIVIDADDDHCLPGELRNKDQNVTFGTPRHRGATGGAECRKAFNDLCHSLKHEYNKHDPLIQALALHYHLAAMHPFLDGNGRTARALEALMLQKIGLKDVLFISMSNYYYEEKTDYLGALAEVRTNNHNLTPFFLFGLKGIELQCNKLLNEININVSKALFRNVMYDLFNRLRTTRKRVIAERQIRILKLLLTEEHTYSEIKDKLLHLYGNLQNPIKALVRDINYLLNLGAIYYQEYEEDKFLFFIKLEWPTEITETEFYNRVRELPKAKTHGFL